MPHHLHIRIQGKPQRPRSSIMPRDELLVAGQQLVHAMQYYWLLGLSDARVSRCDATNRLMIDAVAVDQAVLKVAARPPLGLEVDQVHLLRSWEALQKLTEGQWEVSWGALARPVGSWTSASQKFDPFEGNKLILLADEFGLGSPFRVATAGSPLRPDLLPYVPACSIKNLKPVRFELWRWYTASYSVAAQLVRGLGAMCSELGLDTEDPNDLAKPAMIELIHALMNAWGRDIAQRVATAIGHQVYFIPNSWSTDESSPRGLWNGDFSGLVPAQPLDRLPERASIDQPAMIKSLFTLLSGGSHPDPD
ncbi:MAG: hypothetical protein KF869_02805 [Phycisphaeraceae bacterium]|nr:hypothetical protein [Phycisphaeraceae bacterium]